MSLLDDLRAAAQHLDPQFQLQTNELQSVGAALIHYAEHGDKFLQAAEHGVQDVIDLLQPEAPQQDQPAGVADPAPSAPSTPTPGPVDVPAAPADPPADTVPPAAPVATPVADEPAALSDEELDARLADLQAQRDTRRATEQQTVVEHQSADEPEPAVHRPSFFHRS